MATISELKELFPSSKEITITNKIIAVKPMVWTDFIAVIEDFGKVVNELSKDVSFSLDRVAEGKDLHKLIPVLGEVLNVFARWLAVEPQWLKDNLTLKGTALLVTDFLEVNEWAEVKQLFLGLKEMVQTKLKN